MLLRDIATSAIDISDGLVADLSHILEASQCGARLNPETIPLSRVLTALAIEEAWELALTSGDDYELCFTVPTDKKEALEALTLDIPLTCIGTIVPGTGMQWIKSDGTFYKPKNAGYRHF